MGRLWTCGFGLESVTAGVEFDAVTGSPTISTGTKRTGSVASLRCNPSASTAWIQDRVRADSTVRCFLRFYLYIHSGPVTNPVAIARWGDGSGFGWKLLLNTNRTLQVTNESDQNVGSPSSALSLDTWYRIEVDYNDASGDTVNAYVDGVSFCSAAATDVGGGGVVNIGAITSETCDLYFSDIAVNDSAGSYQNSLPGAGNVTYLFPDAAGDSNTFSTQVGGTAGSSNNFTRINEHPPDNATSYNGSNTANEEDLYNCAASGIGSGDVVNVVHVGWRFRRSTTGTGPQVKLECMKTSGGTKAQGSAIIPNSTTWKTNQNAVPNTYPITLYLDPDSASWTQAKLDTMQAGMLCVQTTTPRADVSAIWVVVDYTPASGQTYNESITLSSQGGLSPITNLVLNPSLSFGAGAGINSGGLGILGGTCILGSVAGIITASAKTLETLLGYYEIPPEHIVDLGSAKVCNLSANYASKTIDPTASFDAVPAVDAMPSWDGVVSGKADVKIQIAISTDGANYGDWRDFIPGQYILWKAKWRLRLEVMEQPATPVVSGFSFTVDMPDRIDTGVGISIPADGDTIEFSPAFQATPAVVITDSRPAGGR